MSGHLEYPGCGVAPGRVTDIMQGWLVFDSVELDVYVDVLTTIVVDKTWRAAVARTGR